MKRLLFEPFSSLIGELYIIFSGDLLTAISHERPIDIKQGKIPTAFKKELEDYFNGRLFMFKQEVMLLSGTDFEQSVWLALREIPYGVTWTYKELAVRLGKPGASRAVGQALAKNPIPIVLPCHRIIESDGHIGGYSLGGAEVKRRLLEMEYYRLLDDMRR